jgi:hypothetical protein
MKDFHYIDENETEQLDLIRLFQFAFQDLSFDEIVIGISIIQKHSNL